MKRSVHKIVIACAVLGVGIGSVLWGRAVDRPKAWLGVSVVSDPAIDCDVPVRPGFAVGDTSAYQHPPQLRGRRTPLRLPRVQSGIAMGDGTFVPPLNGVQVADGIPPVRRNPRLPSAGPIVAKIVDPSGQEWWEHADGSQTSCSFASVTTRDGVTRQIVSTQHGAVTPRTVRRPR